MSHAHAGGNRSDLSKTTTSRAEVVDILAGAVFAMLISGRSLAATTPPLPTTRPAPNLQE